MNLYVDMLPDAMSCDMSCDKVSLRKCEPICRYVLIGLTIILHFSP